MPINHRQLLLNGLFNRLARAFKRDRRYREFLIQQIANVMCAQ